MGWVWKNDDDDTTGAEFGHSSNPSGDGGRFSTRKVVRSQCRTEEVEPGKFIRKCEKTEELFKDCAGRPTEIVQSNKEYTEEDVTDQMVKGSFSLGSAESESFNFPGLRSDIEAIERSLFGGIDHFLRAAEDMKNDFFNAIRVPHMFDDKASSTDNEIGIPIEVSPPREAFPEKKSDRDDDFSGLATDV
ncbi:Mal d 1-associated protein [Striga asiatica]|uniref:Mal d 1-associated protein n=1 Tax=Striga asiatica TaxID=4170 RepID=A0A5A7Q9T8_STRAF|nr:Mal d 1-associated protein [Striga asiatica]